jgi:hypothetical protein
VWLLELIMAFAGKPKLAAIIAFLIGCSTFALFGKVLRRMKAA